MELKSIFEKAKGLIADAEEFVKDDLAPAMKKAGVAAMKASAEGLHTAGVKTVEAGMKLKQSALKMEGTRIFNPSGKELK